MLRAAQTGSREALGQALEACRGYLLVIAEQELAPELHAKGGASDLVQETFLDAQRDFARFAGDSEQELRAWLRQILLHNLDNFARRYRLTEKRALEREMDLPACRSSSFMPGGVAAAGPSPSGEAMDHEQAAALQRALEQLPEDYRQAICLRYQEEKSFEEIGRLMNRSANTARKLWLRAVEKLQAMLEPRP